MGAGGGDWRLVLSSEQDIQVLANIRTEDPFVANGSATNERSAAGTRRRFSEWPGTRSAEGDLRRVWPAHSRLTRGYEELSASPPA